MKISGIVFQILFLGLSSHAEEMSISFNGDGVTIIESGDGTDFIAEDSYAIQVQSTSNKDCKKDTQIKQKEAIQFLSDQMNDDIIHIPIKYNEESIKCISSFLTGDNLASTSFLFDENKRSLSLSRNAIMTESKTLKDIKAITGSDYTKEICLRMERQCSSFSCYNTAYNPSDTINRLNPSVEVHKTPIVLPTSSAEVTDFMKNNRDSAISTGKTITYSGSMIPAVARAWIQSASASARQQHSDSIAAISPRPDSKIHVYPLSKPVIANISSERSVNPIDYTVSDSSVGLIEKDSQNKVDIGTTADDKRRNPASIDGGPESSGFETTSGGVGGMAGISGSPLSQRSKLVPKKTFNYDQPYKPEDIEKMMSDRSSEVAVLMADLDSQDPKKVDSAKSWLRSNAIRILLPDGRKFGSSTPDLVFQLQPEIGSSSRSPASADRPNNIRGRFIRVK